MATAEGGPERQFLTYDGPQKGVTYPVKVIYCGGDHHFFPLLVLVLSKS